MKSEDWTESSVVNHFQHVGSSTSQPSNHNMKNKIMKPRMGEGDCVLTLEANHMPRKKGNVSVDDIFDKRTCY